MNNVAIVAIDLGKHTFHLHAQDDRGHELYHKKFNRAGLARHLANLEPCTVAMEACGGAHYMAREAAKWGHVPKLIAPPRASLREKQQERLRRCHGDLRGGEPPDHAFCAP